MDIEQDPGETTAEMITVEDTTTATNTTKEEVEGGSSKESDLMGRLYDEDKRGTPFATRDESIEAMKCLMGSTETLIDKDILRPPITNVYGPGPLLVSDIPSSAKQQSGGSGGVCVGIDEAGRGSVLGPMVYGAAFWNSKWENDDNKSKSIIPKGFQDSKQLTDEIRAKLLQQLMACKEIGWCTRIFHASEISRNMLRPIGSTYNLNQMSHDAAMDMIQALLDAGVCIQTCYVDTVGDPKIYARKLQRRFPHLEFVVESKADAKYPTCSAASVVAKVLRDRILESWQFTEPAATTTTSRKFGSGYPSDPHCKAWMANNLNHPVFGWSDLVRFSWVPAKKALLENDAAVEVTFEADDEEEEGEDLAAIAGRKRQQEQMSAFLRKGSKDLRYPYFERNNLKTVTNVF